MNGARAARTGAIVLAALLAAPVADAQVWGRRGFSWQPEIQLERDEMAKLEADLDRLSREEWRAEALAWLELEWPAPDRLAVTESDRVAGLDFRKRVEIRVVGADELPSRWEVAFSRKPQRRMAVVMTDVDDTRVSCGLGELFPGGGALGVFQHQGYLLCLSREPERREEPPTE